MDFEHKLKGWCAKWTEHCKTSDPQPAAGSLDMGTLLTIANQGSLPLCAGFQEVRQASTQEAAE